MTAPSEESANAERAAAAAAESAAAYQKYVAGPAAEAQAAHGAQESDAEPDAAPAEPDAAAAEPGPAVTATTDEADRAAPETMAASAAPNGSAATANPAAHHADEPTGTSGGGLLGFIKRLFSK
jgi:hypothetical protein